jgi:hypothetical protein
MYRRFVLLTLAALMAAALFLTVNHWRASAAG